MLRAHHLHAAVASGLLRASAVALVAGGIMLPMAGLADNISGPAVSGPNGKISIEGGSVSGGGSFLGLGSYTVPLGDRFGAQFDAAFGSASGHLLGGGGAHLFMRDPSKYLLGVYGSYHTWNSIDVWRAAGEVELYHGPLSFTGLAGVEGVNFPATSGGLAVTNVDNSHFFGQFDLSYYPTENLKLTAGYDYVNETGMGTAGVEYLMNHGNNPASLFAKARFGASDYQSVTGGLKVYFGADPKATLITRHRTADPDNYTPVFPVVTTTGGENSVGSCVSDTLYTSQSDCNCDEGREWFDVEGSYCSTPSG